MEWPERYMISVIKHQFFDALRLIGLRDRLRCPRCKAVGTWKPHGGWLDGHDVRKVRRWLCKYCGLYRGPEGELQAHPNLETKVWDTQAKHPGLTPKDRVGADIWPWRG